MLVSAITDRVSEVLQDKDTVAPNVTWTIPELVEWFNDGIRALTLVRPDATAVTVSHQLTANTTKQALSGASDMRLIECLRNMGADGATPGRVIRIVDRSTKDAYEPTWHTSVGGTEIREYMFDELRPDEFWVSPKPLTAFYIEIVKSVLPAVVAAVTDTVPVKDIYAPALIEWICYRAFSRDAAETPNAARAASHFSAFFNLLQVKMQTDMATNPRVREMVSKR